MDNNRYVPFTEEMKKDHTILIPNILPMHFALVDKVLQNHGFHTKLLETQGEHIKELGLKYLHNDTCYSAVFVVGQFLDAVESGRYDPNKVALMIFRTDVDSGTSSYADVIRNALEEAGYRHVPVISFDLAAMEKHTGFKLSLSVLHKLVYSVFYADLLTLLRNQCRSYEIKNGESQALAEVWTERLAEEMGRSNKISYKRIRENYRKIISDFNSIPRMELKKPRIGIIGEIFVKYSPLGNRDLEELLVSEGAEVVVPELLDFCLCCVYNNIIDIELCGGKRIKCTLFNKGYKFLLSKQKDMIDIIRECSDFEPPTSFDHKVSLIKRYVDMGAKTKEGWLLTAEVLDLADKGTSNIVCAHSLGCLSECACENGALKFIKKKDSNINIVALDCDAENRIKLMLENIKNN